MLPSVAMSVNGRMRQKLKSSRRGHPKSGVIFPKGCPRGQAGRTRARISPGRGGAAMAAAASASGRVREIRGSSFDPACRDHCGGALLREGVDEGGEDCTSRNRRSKGSICTFCPAGRTPRITTRPPSRVRRGAISTVSTTPAHSITRSAPSGQMRRASSSVPAERAAPVRRPNACLSGETGDQHHLGPRQRAELQGEHADDAAAKDHHAFARDGGAMSTPWIVQASGFAEGAMQRVEVGGRTWALWAGRRRIRRNRRRGQGRGDVVQAEVHPPAQAIGAMAAPCVRIAGDARAFRDRDAFAAAHHDSREFVAQRQGRLGRKLTVQKVAVGAADAAGLHPDQHLAGGGGGDGDVLGPDRADIDEPRCLHGPFLPPRSLGPEAGARQSHRRGHQRSMIAERSRGRAK